MGTCYSKSGQDVKRSGDDREPYMKAKSKGSLKNGHSVHIEYVAVTTSDSVVIEKFDTDLTTDSVELGQPFEGLDKSQQTSLDYIVKDANKNIEAVSSKETNQPLQLRSDTSETTGVAPSDSGIVIDSTDPQLGSNNVTIAADAQPSDVADTISSGKSSQPGAGVVHRPSGLKLKVRPCSCSNSGLSSLSSQQSQQTEHSNCAQCNDKDSRSSMDKVCETDIGKDTSVSDLDKIKLAIQRSSVSTPTEHSRPVCEADTSYELPTGTLTNCQQPEVTTMNLNGREVVVIDQELFSQILDEIQFLKMKLSQLTEVIQDDQEKSSNETDEIFYETES